jgi:hypothetical protein
MYLILLNCTLENDWHGEFYVICISSRLKFKNHKAYIILRQVYITFKNII